jgi:hypothetical protein
MGRATVLLAADESQHRPLAEVVQRHAQRLCPTSTFLGRPKTHAHKGLVLKRRRTSLFSDVNESDVQTNFGTLERPGRGAATVTYIS